MEVTANTTGLSVGLTVVPDKDARDYCVVVAKGLFDCAPSGAMTLAPEPARLVYADEHHGDPEATSIRYECDFALYKPLTDVVVVGKAVAPDGKPARSVVVELEVAGVRKRALVTGDRRWCKSGLGLVPSEASPFVEMPLRFERAFGGIDGSRGPGEAAVEVRNLVGVGFAPHRSQEDLVGVALPNIEDPRRPISSCRARPDPVGFGCVGRSWAPRRDYAGTYDQRWLDRIYPFLPEDFDHRYFQCAPADQQFAHFRGGETIRCVHMAERPVVTYTLPTIAVPVSFRFTDRVVTNQCVLDTVILEPHLARAALVWRTRIVLGKKIEQLRAVAVGEPPDAAEPVDYRRGKPVFRGLAATLRWLRKERQ